MFWRNHRSKTEYLFLELLGEGLTSRVYKAIRKHSDWPVEQIVALKVFKSQDLVRSLKNEIQTLSQVKSPHCVRLLGWEELPEGPALILEPLEGITLLQLFQKERLSVDLQEEILAQTQEGLRDLHSQGLFHGDLNPRNIFITNDGQIKLLDFGLSGEARVGEIYGTPQFLAPEVWCGETPSAASDLFSLGLLYRDFCHHELTCEKSHSQWRQRALELMGENSLLLPKLEQRHFLPVTSCAKRRGQLSQKVRACQAQENSTQTQKISQNHQDSIEHNSPVNLLNRWKPFLAGLLFFFCFHDLQPTTHSLGPLPLKSWLLEVRSHHWLRLELWQKNEKGLHQLSTAYTPAKFKNLPEGEYLLRWEIKNQWRELKVAMRANQVLKIHP